MNTVPTGSRLATCPTTWGVVEIQASPSGLVSCVLPAIPPLAALPPFRLLENRMPASPYPFLKSALKYAAAVLTGRTVALSLARLHPIVMERATSFQRAVWQELQRIPCGSTRTYGEVAEAAGYSRAARATGAACAANPLPVFIPCHRVVAANGRLGGFSSGIQWKQLLLALEAPRIPRTGGAP